MRDGAPGAPIIIKGPETGTDREGRYRAVLYGTGRVVNIDHSWITLDGFTIDGQEQLADVPFPTDVRTIDAWKASIQDRVEDGAAGLHRLGRGVARPHRDHDQQHVPQRRRRRVRAAAQQRPRQHDRRLGDPVLRDVRQGRRRATGPSTTTARASTSAPAPSRTTSRCPTTTPARTTSSRATSSARSGRSASTSRRTRTTTCSKTTCAAATPSPRSSRAATSSCAATPTSCATTRSRTAPATPSRSRPTARSTTGAATSSRTTSSPARPAETFKIKSDATQGRFCGNNVVASGALFNADSDGTMPSGITAPC